MSRFTFQSTRAIRQLKRMTDALTEGPMTRAQLCERLHLSIPMVCDYLSHPMSEPRAVRIKGHLPNHRGRQTPIYALGSGKDATEPPRRTKTDWYRGLQADPVRHALYLARERARDAADRAAVTPQSWLSALVGPRTIQQGVRP